MISRSLDKAFCDGDEPYVRDERMKTGLNRADLYVRDVHMETRLKAHANGRNKSQHCCVYIVEVFGQQCCVRLHVPISLTGFKLYAASANKYQQCCCSMQTDATCWAQQCCVLLANNEHSKCHRVLLHRCGLRAFLGQLFTIVAKTFRCYIFVLVTKISNTISKWDFVF